VKLKAFPTNVKRLRKRERNGKRSDEEGGREERWEGGRAGTEGREGRKMEVGREGGYPQFFRRACASATRSPSKMMDVAYRYNTGFRSVSLTLGLLRRIGRHRESS